MSASSPPTENKNATRIEITPTQAEQLVKVSQLTRAIAAPHRLIILGSLANRPGQVITLDQLAELTGLTRLNLERDVRQLADTGLIEVEEWQASTTGEPVPYRLIFQPQALQKLQPMIAALSQLTRQLQPAEPVEIMDERTKTVVTFIKNGRLTGWPAQFKRQVYVVEEIAKNFEPEVRYNENQVDDILKQIYEYDHCTLRRYLVDLKFLQRANGYYWKTK